jgi:hypothetical protein
MPENCTDAQRHSAPVQFGVDNVSGFIDFMVNRWSYPAPGGQRPECAARLMKARLAPGDFQTS